MTDQIVTSAQATIQALTELLERTARERDEWKGECVRLRALLAHSRTSLAEVSNDPMDDGKPGGEAA